MEAKTRSDRLADWHVQPEQLIERLVKVKAEALLNALADTLAAETYGKTPGDMGAKTLTDALA